MIHAIILVLIILCIFIIYEEIRKWFISKKLRNFKSPKQAPILGAAIRFIGKTNDELIETFLNIFDEVESTPLQMWLGPMLTIGISQPEDIETVLKSEDCLNKPYLYELLKCKTSILATDKEIWKPHRRALNSAFNVKMLQNYVPIINDLSRQMVKKMEPFLGERGDLYRTIFIAQTELVGRTLFGSKLQITSERLSSLFNSLKLVMNNVQYRILRFWLRWDFVFNLTKVGREEQIPLRKLIETIDQIYEHKVKELDTLKSQGIDHLTKVAEQNATNFLERCLILEQDGIISHENVHDQMRVMIVAGIDTSSTTVYATLLLLAINQKHQDLVVKELRSIFDTADCDVTQDHLGSMQYLDRVIKEALRLIPPIPFIARKTSADIQLAKGIIPQDSMVFIHIMKLHRNPTIWGKNALEFDPDRFLPENVAKRPPFSYIPFSGGARNCIGMKYGMISAKIVLANILRRYKFTTDLKFEDIRARVHIVLELTNENPLRIDKRNF
ncbi:probable cytochrome P450 313a4 [Sitodiplosis mosellana]|uniref:probable cytochrome P450 313a4 n=1 Tax=Sitodiplosis mosellana TaxID=263140 RepID=UPI00244495C8|nr:probable cytochrome P450 313a4 [Sitodiplosis mosellana]